MIARDVMASPVITARANSTVRDVARLLLDKRISAVPVVDEKGKVVGIVTEKDLMHRAEAGTERRASRWLELLSGDASLAADYIESHARRVGDLMTRQVVTVSPETPLYEVASLLERNQIKRVPVVNKSGDLVGIVSRANLLQAVATARPRLELHLPDSAIRERLLEHLNKQPWSHTYGLNVTVANGVVDLWGMIDSDEERRAIRVAAENVVGVSTVNDHLVHRPSSWQ